MTSRVGQRAVRISARPLYAGAIIFAIALAFRLGYFIRALQVWDGVRFARDTNGFDYSCELLATDPISVLSATKGLEYLGFTIPYCGLQAATGGSGIVVVLVQIMLSSLTAVLIFVVGRRLVGNLTGVVAGIGFALSFDVTRYTVFLLSETTFVAAVAVSVWALLRYRERPTRRAAVVLLCALGWLAITRPFGPPIVVGWLLLDLLPVENEYRLGLVPRPIAVAGVLILPIVVLLVSSAPQKLLDVENGFRGGWILFQGQTAFPLALYDYTPRPAEGFIEFLLFNLDHVAIMATLRTLVFYLPLVDVVSPVWNVVNALVLAPLLIGAAVGAVRAWRQTDRRVLILLLPPIVVVTGIVAVTHVGLGWRFRVPLVPLFAVLAGYAVQTSPRTPSNWPTVQTD